MIIQLTGQVNYPITLDPSVWIFDDRKILYKDAFTRQEKKVDEEKELKATAKHWDDAVTPDRIRPPVNKSIYRFERERILTETYVMPLKPFIEHAEIKAEAQKGILYTKYGEKFISIEQLVESLLLFSVDGKPLKQDGPVHLYFGDGSNNKNPIKGVTKIEII